MRAKSSNIVLVKWMNRVRGGQVSWLRSHNGEMTQAGANPKPRLFLRPAHQGEGITHAHTNMHPPCCRSPAHTFCTHLHPRPSADSPHLPSHLSPGNRLWQGHTLLPMLVSHPPLSPPPPPRLKKAGWCMLPSTPTALAPSLPPQAPLTTLAPVF